MAEDLAVTDLGWVVLVESDLCRTLWVSPYTPVRVQVQVTSLDGPHRQLQDRRRELTSGGDR